MPIVKYQNGNFNFEFRSGQGPYPFMPAGIGDAVLEASTNLRISVPLAAHAALGTVSLVCQPYINVHCPSYDPAPVSLFLLLIGNSASGKSPAERKFLRAVFAFECIQKEEIERAMFDYSAEMKIWQDDGRRLTKEYRDATPGSVETAVIRAQRREHEKNRPIKPKIWDLRYGEVSPQGLTEALVVDHAVGIFSTEGGQALTGLTFREPALLCGYWSGEDKPVALVSGNRRPIEPRLTISVMTQVQRFETYMKSRGSDAFAVGLLARFLTAASIAVEWPDQLTQIDDLPEPKLDIFNQRVTNILKQPRPEAAERMTLKLSDGAKRYWKAFKDAVHKEAIQGSYSDDMKSVFNKSAQQATRLAALFHYFDGAAGDISPQAMESAIDMCEWYLWEAMTVFRQYAPSDQDRDEKAAQDLLSWLQETVAEPWRYPKLILGRYTERDLRNYSCVRGKPEVLTRAINILHQQGHIGVQRGQKKGLVIFYPSPATAFGAHWQRSSDFETNTYTIDPAQYLDSPIEPTRLQHVAVGSGTLKEDLQRDLNTIENSNPSVDRDEDDFESNDLRSVKRQLVKLVEESWTSASTPTVRNDEPD